MVVRFKSRISKFGKGRYMIYIPISVHPMIKNYIGKNIIVNIEEEEEE